MGFYGNIQNSNKVALQFDLVYSNRSQMDAGVGVDGVFLGRYVAIDYGEMPVVGYYNIDDKQFYTVRDNQTADTRITPKVSAIYQDLTSDTAHFYYYDDSTRTYTPATEQVLSHLQLNSAYVTNYTKDVTKYGAAYDGTVWQKTYDAVSDQYKYVLIAELNAKVPSFHLVVDKPTETPVTPYFDRDSTNMDYYLHLAPSYGHRIKTAEDSNLSDETALRYEIDYKNVGTTDISWDEVERTVNGDIYYNKDGFNDAKRTYSNVENTINYDYAKSGRLYGQQEGPVPVAGTEEIDTYDWFFRIPALGNAICTVWDKLYGYNTKGERFRNLSKVRDDTSENLVTYDRDTIYGTINELRDALGYTFIDIDDITSPRIYDFSDPATTITVQNTYIRSNNTTKTINIQYPALNCIFYRDTRDEKGQGSEFFVFVYSPKYTEVQGAPKDDGVTQYFIKEGNEYKVANIANYQAKDRNGQDIDPEYQTYYTRKDHWVWVGLETTSQITSRYHKMFDVYGLISTLHRLMGFGEEKNRDLNTIYGSINYIKDIIDSIDSNLSPGKMLHVNDKGVIETTGTYYPSSTVDADRVLVGNPNEGTKQGAWENRVRSLGVLTPEISDSVWTENTGVIDTNVNNKNQVDFKAGNKWIGLNVQTGNAQQIQILHTKSTQSEHDFNTDVSIDDDLDGSKTKDCPITLPFVLTDNAGHITGYDTKTFYIPYNFRNITLRAQSTSEDEMTTSNGTMQPESVNDTFTFATGNQWIRAKIDEDKITFAHALIDTEANQNWEFKSIAEEGWQKASKDGNKLTIPTFEIDNAGHIVRNSSVDFYIPHNFRDINVITATGEDVDSVQTNGKLEADNTIDNWSFASQNKWLRVAADADNDIITIGHSYSSQAAHDFNNTTDIVIATALDGTAQTDNSIVLPFLKTDNAGHVVGYSTNKFYIPHTFKTITVTTDNDTDVDSVQTNGNIVADNIVDTWTIAPQNKWIDIAADENNDKITIGHKYSPIAKWDFMPSASDALAKNNQDNSFTIPTFSTDNAGHIISTGSTTFYVPHTFKKIKVEAQSGVATEVTPSTTAAEIEAENIVDTFTIATGNKWVQTTSDENNDKVTFSHKLSGVTASTYGTNSVTALEPKFGDTFEVPGYNVDEAGHITSSTTHTVKIPQASYSDNKQDGNVMVGFELTDNTTSAFKGTHTYVGTLGLTGYVANDDIAAISSSDTINSAFAKSEARLENEAKIRGEEDERIYNDATSWSQTYTDNRITSLINSAPEALDTLGELAAALKNENEEISTTIVSMITSNTNSINANKASIDALDASLETEKKTRATEDAKLLESINKEMSLREETDQKRHEEFTNAIAVEIQDREQAIEGLNKVINTEISNREQADQEFTNALVAEAQSRTLAIKSAVQAALDDLLANYGITLNKPEFEIIVDEENYSLTVNLLKYLDDIYTYSWYKKQVDENPILVTDAVQMIVAESGEYYCVIERTHNGHTSTKTSEIYEIILPEPEPEPEPIEPAPEEPVIPDEEV